MAKLRIPSLQHLARNWRPTPSATQKELVRLAENPPTFGYGDLERAVRDMLMFAQPYEDVVRGIELGVKREDVRNAYLSALPLVRQYFNDISADFVHDVAARYYSVARELRVPFKPTFVYGSGGALHIPWFSFWRSKPLEGEQLALFATIARQILVDDPELETVQLAILDLSARTPKGQRELRVIDIRAIETLPPKAVASMLGTYVEGYRLAVEELSKRASEMPAGAAVEPDIRQLRLIEDDD